MRSKEPKSKQGQCSFCGDASVNHSLFYFGNLLSYFFDDHMLSVTKRAPRFLKDFIDLAIIYFIRSLVFLKIARFSTDIEQAATFRSRIIWEEAERRGIKMEQLFAFGRPLDYYRAEVVGQKIYFESIPIPPALSEMQENWDDKFTLKRELALAGIPVPHHFELPLFPSSRRLEGVFLKLAKPIVVKPKVGSRGRHTITGIKTLEQFKEGVGLAKLISPNLIVEKHLSGSVCRATLVDGVLAGFFRGRAPYVVGNGASTINDLIAEKDKHRPERVEPVRRGEELKKHLERLGFSLDSIPKDGEVVVLSHRIGRLFGGSTEEMIERLHPSFLPVFERAAQVTGLPVVGFDSIIPDPEKDAGSQEWGIIECNTLPFIDLHYYALSGRPKNIAGMIWDLWKSLPSTNSDGRR
jgi:cyanophycin synthetase